MSLFAIALTGMRTNHFCQGPLCLLGEDPRGGVGLRTRGILTEKADCKQAIKYSILLLMLVVLELKYNFACFSQ